MVKTEQQQAKASDVWTGNIYNLLAELKQAYAQYEDLLAELKAKGNQNDSEYEENDKKNITYAAKIIRQTITMLEIEIGTLEGIKRIKTTEKLAKAREDWKKQNSYLPDTEKVLEYLIALNTTLTEQILNKVYTNLDGIYGKN